MEFKIEKDIPPPGEPGSTGKGLTQTLRNLQVGESFLMPLKLRGSFYACARGVPAYRFKTRAANESDLRVWRVA